MFKSVERVFLPKLEVLYQYFMCFKPTRLPLQIAYYRSHSFDDAIKRLLPSHDGILFGLIRCGDYVLDVDIPKILEMTDAISLNYNRVKQLSHLVLKA